MKIHKYKYLAFITILSIITISNLALGISGLIGGENLLAIIKIFYGATLDLTPQAAYIIKMLGVYMIGISIMGFLALKNPIKHAGIVNGIIILLFLRFVQRIIFFNEAREIFNIPFSHMIAGTVMFLVLPILLYILKPNKSK